MLAPYGFDRMPLTPDWIDWNSPIEIDQDLAKELGVANWWPGWPIGGNTLYDLAGNANGTLTGGPAWTFADSVAPALSLDGTDDYVPCSNVTAMTSVTNFTLMFHAYKASTSAYCPVGIKGTVTTRTGIFGYGDSRTYFLVENGANSFPSYASPAAGIHHYAMAYNGGLSGLARIGAYLNGVSTALSSGGSDPGTTTSSATDFEIGRGTDGSFRYAAARIWDVILCKHTLSAAQVHHLARNPFALAWQPSRLSMFWGSEFQYPRAPYLTGYNTRLRVTIDNKHVDDDLTNFPVMVKFADHLGIANFLDSNGYNIRFTTDDGETPISYDRRSYSVTNGRASGVLFARVPTVYADHPTDIYMYLKSADPVDGEDKADVWQDYAGVWPLNEASGNAVDVSGNGLTLTQSGTVGSDTGQIGNSRTYSLDNYHSLENARDEVYPGDADFTVQALVRPNSMSFWNNHGIAACDAGTPFTPFALFYNSLTDRYNFRMGDGGGTSIVVANNYGGLVTGEWVSTYAGFIAANNQIWLSVNNGPSDTASHTRSAYTFSDPNFFIGKAYSTTPFAGRIDEVRIRHTLLTDAWRKFEYHNIFESNYDLHFGNIEHNDDYLTGYTKRKTLTVDYAHVDDDLDDFPLLVKIEDDFHVGEDIDASGYNIRFTLDDGLHELSYDRRSFAVASDLATGVFFVRVPKIYAHQVTRLKIYYKSADPVDGEDKADVWQDYIAVWPLDDASGSSADISGNSQTLSDNNSVGTGTGVIGGARDIEYDNAQYLSRAAASASAFDFLDTAFTWSFLMRAESTGSAQVVLAKGDAGSSGAYYFLRGAGAGYEFGVRNSGGWTYNSAATGVFTVSTWHYVSLSHNPVADQVRVLINTDAPRTHAFSGGFVSTSSTNLTVGALSNGSNYFDGLLDEMRVRADEVPAAWHKFEYHNIFETDNDLAFSAEESAPAAPSSGSRNPYGGVAFVMGGYQPFSPVRRWRYNERPDEPPTP